MSNNKLLVIPGSMAESLEFAVRRSRDQMLFDLEDGYFEDEDKARSEIDSLNSVLGEMEPWHYVNGDADSYLRIAMVMSALFKEVPFSSFTGVRFERHHKRFPEEEGVPYFILECDGGAEYPVCIDGDSNFAALESLIKKMGQHC